MPFDLVLLLPFFLYAEIHYRFRYFFSFLRTREPEILADVPHRLEPNRPLPILLYVKDAHLYPLTLHRVQAEIRSAQSTRTYGLLSEQLSTNEKHWWRVFHVDLSDLNGWIEVLVLIDMEVNGKRKLLQTDNYRTASHAALKTYVAREPLPRFAGLHFGDAHTHSNYTEDQVEFGAPLRAARDLSEAMGLSFFCTTDHSYDLDDCVDNYLHNDPALPKWNALQDEVTRLNDEGVPFVIVRGEEATVRNREGRNVHLLIYGNRRFIPGSGDGAERWFQTRSEHDIPEAIQLKEPNALAFAAHVSEPVPALQRILLGRGSWSAQDFQHDGLLGLQFANGSTGKGFDRGLELWIKLLLQGCRLFAVAGNDAHGNFNRFRQVGLPFFTIRESNQQIFGKMRTGIFTDGPLNERALLEAMRDGKMILTDGPVVRLVARNEQKRITTIGGEARGTTPVLQMEAMSSTEFGSLAIVRCYQGRIGDGSETVILKKDLALGTMRWTEELAIHVKCNSYVRAVVSTSPHDSLDGESHFCISNPIWLTKEP